MPYIRPDVHVRVQSSLPSRDSDPGHIEIPLTRELRMEASNGIEPVAKEMKR